MALADDLGKLAELHANGGLTEEEFRRAKERLLNTEQTHSHDPVVSAVNTFRRSSTDRWFGGVCGGIARSLPSPDRDSHNSRRPSPAAGQRDRYPCAPRRRRRRASRAWLPHA